MFVSSCLWTPKHDWSRFPIVFLGSNDLQWKSIMLIFFLWYRKILVQYATQKMIRARNYTRKICSWTSTGHTSWALTYLVCVKMPRTLHIHGMWTYRCSQKVIHTCVRIKIQFYTENRLSPICNFFCTNKIFNNAKRYDIFIRGWAYTALMEILSTCVRHDLYWEIFNSHLITHSLDLPLAV